MALFLAATLALLFLGNTVFTGTNEGMARTFQASLTADISISSASEDPFTLFGSELPLLGEFFKMPLILEYDKVLAEVQAVLPEAQLQPVVVGAAKISFQGFNEPAPLFSVDIAEYLQFFPSLKLVLGKAPPAGEPGLFLNERMFAKASAVLKAPPRLGDKFLLASAQEGSFALREVPLAGVFAYPASDALLDNVALVDVGTGRALAGYFITQASGVDSAEPVSVGSVNDLFANAEDSAAPTEEGISFEKVTKTLAEDGVVSVEDPKTWNFLLIKSPAPELDAQRLREVLRDSAAPLQVRDWRDTAGGNAKIVWFIQLLFNLGLVFISLVAGLIVMNSMSLAVAERTREIGTMRSLGASRGWVAELISWETILLVTGSGVAGVSLGVILILVVSATGGLIITNPFLATLLGTDQYRPSISLPLVWGHLALSLGLGVFATILPIRKALQVSPLQAMARE